MLPVFLMDVNLSMWIVQFYDIFNHCRFLQKVGLSKDGIGEEDFINKMKQFVKCQTLYLGTFYLSTILTVLSFFFLLFTSLVFLQENNYYARPCICTLSFLRC